MESQVESPNIQSLLERLKNLTKTRYSLPIVICVALALRLTPLRLKYLLGYDTYFHAAYIEYTAAVGKWINFFPYANAPWGMLINQFHPKGFWMIPFYLHKLLSPFGISLKETFSITPPVIGISTIIFIYFAIKMLYGEKEALLSAFFLSISFGHIFRSMANYYRGDNYLLFWYSLSLLGIGLALSTKNKKIWKNKRFVMYLIPGVSAGLSAGFWSAYYLIFIFLMANAIFIAIGATILRKSWAFVDSIMLTVSTALGAVIANIIGAHLGYGLFGWNRPDGIEAAKLLQLEFRFIKDAFLLTYLNYVVPTAVLLIILLIIAVQVMKNRQDQIVLTTILMVTLLLASHHYWNSIEEAFLSFLQKFGEEAISETQKTSLMDAWISYGTLLIGAPFFTLRMRLSRIKISDFLIVSFAIPSIIMIILWTRFLFIGSLAVSVLSGIGTIELITFLSEKNIKKQKLIAMTIVSLLIIPTGILGFQNTLNVKPFVNEKWEIALNVLEKTSNKNDVILTWWDQGYWVTYFSHRGTLSKGVPDELVAKYYLGLTGDDELMNLGVDYVIVSYDTILKFPSILKTARVCSNDYSMIPMLLIGETGKALVFIRDEYSIIAKPEKYGWNIIVSVGGTTFSPLKAFVEDEHGVKAVNVTDITGIQKVNAYIYINLNYGYAILMNEKAFNTNLARLMFTEEMPNYQMVYSDGGYIKIFRLEHPNVAVRNQGASLVLRFTDTIGTQLVIKGFVDNGTRVFTRVYNITGLKEFILPNELNGSVVVRYTYERRGKVLDRGVFRLDTP